MLVHKDIVVALPFSFPAKVLRTENGRWFIQFGDSDGRVVSSCEYPATFFSSWNSARWSANAHNNALHTAEMNKREEDRKAA